jgi:hypothetical protein
MFTIKEVSQELLNALFRSNVHPRVQVNHDEIFQKDFTPEELQQINEISSTKATVVGIDIYKYSQLPTTRQMFVPHLFDEIYDETWHLIRQNFSFLFQEYGKLMEQGQHIDYASQFISTGDGGYQILPTPMHGIVFVVTFAAILRFYNSDRFMRKLHARIGNIEVRYALTHDELYRFKKGYYGSAIISNARILGKDRLDRCLIDQNTHEWFLSRTIGIENLMSWSLENFETITDFADYDRKKITDGHNALIGSKTDDLGKEGFKSVLVQKIGKIRQKDSLMDIYNLHCQVLVHYQNLFGHEAMETISVGNLNTSGLESE